MDFPLLQMELMLGDPSGTFYNLMGIEEICVNEFSPKFGLNWFWLQLNCQANGTSH